MLICVCVCKTTHTHFHNPKHTAIHTNRGCSFNFCTVLQQHLHNTTMTALRCCEQGSATILHHHHVLGGGRFVGGRSVRERGRRRGQCNVSYIHTAFEQTRQHVPKRRKTQKSNMNPIHTRHNTTFQIYIHKYRLNSTNTD